MLSILIPTYNYDVKNLVDAIYMQATKAHIDFEIIVMDDCSEPVFKETLEVIDKEHVKYIFLDKNVGRSIIRNKLAQKAQYNNLVFLDADTLPKQDDFILKYLETLKTHTIVDGGMTYKKDNENMNGLRYKYGIKRESVPALKRILNPHGSFIGANFAIKKEVFETVAFDETITTYGYEDTLFALSLKEHNIPIHHIDNPVYHLQFESGRTFALKIQSSLKNLLYYYKQQKILPGDIKLLKLYSILETLKLRKLVSFVFKKNYDALLKHLSGQRPKLWVFDLYRIGFLCSLNAKND